MTGAARPSLPPGLVAVVKRGCPTCALVAPVLADLAARAPLTVYSQDDPAFPPGLRAVDDTSLAVSWHHGIETVPTLLRVGADGREEERARHQKAWPKEAKKPTGKAPRGSGRESGKPTSARKTVRLSCGKSTRTPKPADCQRWRSLKWSKASPAS